MSYSGLGLTISGSASFSTSGAQAGGSVSTGTKPSAGACEGSNWWKCAGLVVYFTSSSGGGYPKLGILKSGSWDKVQLAVIDGLEALGMLNAKSGWANVKSHVRAMAFFMNRARASGMNMDFDDALNRLTTTAAYAYDKAVEEDQKAAAVAAAQKMYMANVPPPPPKKFDTAAIAKALASVPQPKAAVIQHVSTAPVQPESHTGLFLVGALVLVAAAGGGYYLYSSKKKAS